MPMEIVFKNTMNDKNKLTKVSFLSPKVILVPCPLMHLLPVVKRTVSFVSIFFNGGGEGEGGDLDLAKYKLIVGKPV